MSTTQTLHPLVQSYKSRISEAFEAEGYTVLDIDVIEEEGRVALDYSLEDRENDQIPDVRIWFYPSDFSAIEEGEEAAFQPDFLEHAYSVEDGVMRDPEQMRQLEEIFEKQFEEGLDFVWMDE